MPEPASTPLPAILLTGASGFIGRYFIQALKEHYIIYAIARRSQHQVKIDPHPNIKWLQVDISHQDMLKGVISTLKKQGPVDFVLHLAGYYDFEYNDCPQYQSTNIDGTRYLLEGVKELGIKRFIFASSLAACNFPAPGGLIDEKTPPDAEYPYAVSKKAGEEMVKEYSKHFNCSIVRLAAVYSDWCEYGPLYMFLSTWLSRQWNARILGGKGLSAIPFIHVKDLIKLFVIILEKNLHLPRLDTYNASPDGSTTHMELFEIATRYYFRKTVKPYHVPKFLAYPGVIARDILGRMIGNPPFEKPWMLKYMDLKLHIDSQYTRKTLEWEPTPRLMMNRRLLFLIEHMASSPHEWHQKNQAALKHAALQPDYLIYERMLALKDQLLNECKNYLLSPSRSLEFRNYQRLGPEKVKWYLGTLLQLMTSAVRTGDRMLMLNYARDLGQLRFQDGFKVDEVRMALEGMGDIVIHHLTSAPELKGLKQLIHNHIGLTIQLAVDELEDAYEEYISHTPQPKPKPLRTLDVEEVERQIREYENQLQNQIQNFFSQ